MNKSCLSEDTPVSDPYRELELYLEKVNEEIGRVFDQCFLEVEETARLEPRTPYNLEKWPDHCHSATDLADEAPQVSRSDPEPLELRLDYVCAVHTATQTSPTLSHRSSPSWVSDCSSSFAYNTSGSGAGSAGSGSASGSRASSVSEHGDEIKSGQAAASGVLESVEGASSDSELLPRQRYPGAFRSLKKDCEDDPVWVPRHQDVRVQRRQRSIKDRRGVVFDEDENFALVTDALDEPSNNLSAHSLPLPAGRAPARDTLVAPPGSKVYSVPIADLGNKSSSAPVLKKADGSSEQLSSHRLKVTKQPRSQSDRHLVEIQAAEACKWLRAAGFPQYAQMYEDHQFLIDLSSVRKDHPSLDPDSLQSLFRRLETLNNIKVDSWRSTRMDDSEDENQCALSENWTFQYDQKRWSRTRTNEPLQQLQPSAIGSSENIKYLGKDDGELAKLSDQPSLPNLAGSQLEDVNFSRSGSERIKDGAKALLRRVESLKSRRRKHQNRERVIISGPHITDVASIQKFKQFNCHDIPGSTMSADNSFDYGSPQSSPLPSSPLPSPHRLKISSPLPLSADIAKKKFIKRRGSVCNESRDVNEVMSDSECQKSSRKLRSVNSIPVKIRKEPNVHSPRKLEALGMHSSDYDSDADEVEVNSQARSSWHSFQRGLLHPEVYESFQPDGCPITRLTCGQLQVLRKLALLRLTTIIEKHCPTHKAGWNWELPKFIRKIKSPDYKDKSVFGVPLNIVLQRTGQPLPKPIQEALDWLRDNALDQVGLFRKSGVRSRIQSLKTMVEKNTAPIRYDIQQAYDVADMIKQYFRELPEVLLTTKLSETLILIFQHVPVNLREEAVSCVLLLMPNEHAEVLLTILEFLQVVSEHCSINQMTVSNLSLCFAPSLFNYSHAPAVSSARPNSVSPRRWKQTGMPDAKELSENKAAYECLMYLIKHQLNLFMVSKDMLTQCSFTDMDESKPVALSELGSDQQRDWTGYQDASTKALLKEARERSRGWVGLSDSHNTDVELAYKKVGDGHPLRLWRVATEVEAPPQEVMHRVLRERHIWDSSVLEVRMVEKLNNQSEVFQYTCASMKPLVPRDFCVLRTWGTEARRGGCTIVETSVEHPQGEVLVCGSVRAIVLASRYLIEPCGSGKSRVVHLSRVDMMGRTPEWYNKNYGHMCRLLLANIRNSFKHSAVGPESKV